MGVSGERGWGWTLSSLIFFCCFLIEVKCTQHKISYLKANSSVAFSTVTVPCKHPLSLVPGRPPPREGGPVPIRWLVSPSLRLLGLGGFSCPGGSCNGIARHTAFCVWACSLSTVSPRWVHIVAGVAGSLHCAVCPPTGSRRWVSSFGCREASRASTCLGPCFIWGHVPRSRIAGCDGLTILHSGCAVLHSHQPTPDVQISPHPR